MSDIDFDELDRAVNSLISSQPMPKSSNGEVKEKVLNIKTRDSRQTPGLSGSQAGSRVSSLGTSSVPARSPLLERRSGGQFMDVVHPSSNMRSAPAPISSSGSMTPSTPVRPQPSVGNTPVNLNMSATPTSAAGASPKETSLSSVPESPFVSDAKVEKRPLGAFSSEQQPVAVSVQPQTPVTAPQVANSPSVLASTPTQSNQPIATPAATSSKDDDKTPSNEGVSKSTADVEVPLPAELQTDLLQIESGVASDVDETQSNDNIATAATVAAASSINRQYAEKPSTVDKTSGDIYDTKSYHKAIGGKAVQPAKKKSGWTWVIWIILLLILGAGGGAAVYWFFLR